MSSELQSVDEAKDYLKNVLQNIVDHREYQEKVFKPIYDFLLDQKIPEQQSKQVLHKLQVMGGTCNDAGYELINRLIKNASEFSRREIPDPVNQALEFYYGKKIDYIDSSKEKKLKIQLEAILKILSFLSTNLISSQIYKKWSFTTKLKNLKDGVVYLLWECHVLMVLMYQV